MLFMNTHRYIMEYSLTIKNNNKEILPFVTIWIDLENIMPREISHRMTKTVLAHLYVESKTKMSNSYKEQKGGYQGTQEWGN